MTECPKILIVEDDLELRQSLIERLSHGFKPISASNAQELFTILNEQKTVDAILLDVLLPGVDGLSVCRQIRNGKKQFSSIPIIMVSALGDPTDRVAGLHAGADDYIAKPFFTAELIARIHAILRRSSASRQSEAVQNLKQICFGEWELNRKIRQLTNKNGVSVTGTPYCKRKPQKVKLPAVAFSFFDKAIIERFYNSRGAVVLAGLANRHIL